MPGKPSTQFRAVITLIAALTLQGCAGGVSSRDVAGYDGRLAQGDYPGAAAFAAGAAPIAPDGSSPNLLWSLNAGAAMVYAGDAAHTVPVLDHAEDMIGRRDVGTMQEQGQYRAKTYDGVMVNAYKAIAAMEMANRGLARVELKRAEDRQDRAEKDFATEVAADRARNPSGDVDMRSALNSAESNPEYRAALRDMNTYGGYRPFVNPFATYLAGLFLLNAPDGNAEMARNAFQRVRGMNPSAVVDADYALAQRRGKFPPKTWVLFENGQGSTLSEYSFTIPIPIVGRRSGISVVRVAMPRLQENGAATQGLLVGDAGVPTVVVGNFDYVMRSEFARRYPSILATAIAEVALKAVAQNLAAQEKSGVASLLTAIASQISTADTRSWTALPKDFQAARIEAPKSGSVRLRTAEGGDLGTATVPSNESSIVYVKAMRPGSRPSIQVLRF